MQCTEEKNFLLLPEIEPLFLNHWVCVLIAVGTDATALCGTGEGVMKWIF
jgi:hypothetical protein